jgi:hypothetical protein
VYQDVGKEMVAAYVIDMAVCVDESNGLRGHLCHQPSEVSDPPAGVDQQCSVVTFN